MGDPKFSRKLYETPSHPWQSARIKEENEIVKKYGLKNKTEVWKARSRLRSIRGQARDLQGKQLSGIQQVGIETVGLLGRLGRMGLISDGARLNDILALNVEAVLMRRLQTVVYLKGLAGTPTQARQLIVHGHVAINGSRVNVPGYHVMKAEEVSVEYSYSSPLQNADHPLRPKVIESQYLMEIAPPEPGRQRPAGRGRGPNAGGGAVQRAQFGDRFGGSGGGGRGGPFGGRPGGGSRGRGTGAPAGARRPGPAAPGTPATPAAAPAGEQKKEGGA